MIPSFNDEFYNEMFQVWTEIHYLAPKDSEEICRQPLWNNINLVTDGKCFNYSTWKNQNLYFIQDLVTESGNIISKNALENKHSIRCKLLEYERLTHAIPKSWKTKLKESKMLNKKHHASHDLVVTMQGKFQTLEETKTKQIYWHFVEMTSQRPTSENKWNEKIDFVIDEDMWNIIYKLSKNSKRYHNIKLSI
jgi:hypothetical protein